MTRPAKPERATWVSPYITVQDVDSAANFYKKAFNFTIEGLAPGEDGTHWHGELRYKDQMIMIGKQGGWENKQIQAPKTSNVESPISLYIYCENVDKFHQHAVAAGAISLGNPEDMFWGDRMCRLQDPDGYTWCFATNVADHK